MLQTKSVPLLSPRSWNLRLCNDVCIAVQRSSIFISARSMEFFLPKTWSLPFTFVAATIFMHSLVHSVISVQNPKILRRFFV